MKEFEDYFSDREIIRRLCIARLKQADASHKQLFYRQISTHAESPKDRVIFDFLPPRRHWNRFRNKCRNSGSNQDQNLVALVRATNRLRSEDPDAGWAVRLSKKIAKIRSRAFRDSFQFNPPVMQAVKKEKEGNEYRAIASFELDDQIIEGLTAKYLRELFDPFFTSSSLAFRCGQRGNPPPTHHEAVTMIQNYRVRHAATGLYAAECDIRGFYDCVSHKTASDSLYWLVHEAQSKDALLCVHPQSLLIFKAYLACYSFPNSVKKQSAALLKGKGRQRGIFPWPRDELREFYKRPSAARIGIPQGGALSCFIANCVLHQADKRVELARAKTGGPYRYLRYCDDMILFAPDRNVCRKVFDAYQAALRELKLPIHPPEPVRVYARELWDKKSRKPFLWGPPLKRSTVPWVQFVGYQIRYDGLVRVKKKSMAKHKAKILAETNRLLNVLESGLANQDEEGFATGLRKNANQIVHRFRQKITAMAVGRRAVHHDLGKAMPRCWSVGFKMTQTQGKKTPLNELKELDRFRERQITRVARMLENVPHVATPVSLSKVRPPRYYGFPFSYVGQFRPGGKSGR